MKRLLLYLGIPIVLFLVIGLLFSSRPTEKSYDLFGHRELL